MSPVENLTHLCWESDGPYDLVETGDLNVGRKKTIPFFFFLKLPLMKLTQQQHSGRGVR